MIRQSRSEQAGRHCVASTHAQSNPSRLRASRWRLAALVATATIALASCSSSGGASTSTSAGSGGQSGSASNAASSGAGKLVALARKGLIFGPTSGVVNPSTLHAATAADIQAFHYKPLSNVKDVAVVVASKNAPGLVHMGNTVVAILATLKIGAHQFYGDFSPTGAQSATNSALASNPSAIVLITITPATITPQIATAKSRHIPIIDGTASEAIDGGGLTAYTSESYNLVQILQAAYIISHGGANAKSVWLTLPTFPTVETKAGLAYLHTVCPGCHESQQPVTLAQNTSPVAFGQLITSVVRANPTAKFITTPAACIPLSAGRSALAQAGSHAIFGSGGCTTFAVGAVNAGLIDYVATTPETWNAFVIVDQLLRVLSGQPPVTGTGPGAVLIDKSNTPTTSKAPTFGPIDRWLLKGFDFVKPYSTAWGVDMSGIVADEK